MMPTPNLESDRHTEEADAKADQQHHGENTLADTIVSVAPVDNGPNALMSVYRKMGQNKNRIFRRTEAGDASGYERAFERGLPDISIRPKFQFTRSDKVFTIGSCFARNIETALVRSGIVPITTECHVPGDLYDRRSTVARNGALNAYTPHSMLDILRLPTRSDRHRAGALQVGEDSWSDMLVTGIRHISTEELDILRTNIIGTYERLAEASLVIITLGFTESWYDATDGLYINKSPALERTALKADNRYSFHNANGPEVIDALDRMIEFVAEVTSGKARVLLTTSPVPLHGTYMQTDVISANMYSKATLLSSAVTVAAKHDHVDYYPSYEMVTFGPKEDVWEFDGVHVKTSYVDKVIGKFLENYLTD